MNQTKGFVSLTFTAFILGTFGVLIRVLSESFSNSGQVLIRSLFATLIITTIILFKKVNPFRVDRTNLKYLLVFSIVFPVSLLCFTISVNLIKVSNSLFMLYVGSLLSTAFFGKFLFKERFSLQHIISLILVLIGLSFFVYPFNIESISLGLVLGISAGIFEGSSHTLRKLMKNLRREVIVFYQSLSGAIIALFFVLFSNEEFLRDFNFTSILVALVFGLLLVTIGFLLVYGFNNFDVNLGTIILATELFFALVINYLVLQESPTVYELIGGLIIFLGSTLTSFKLNSKNIR